MLAVLEIPTKNPVISSRPKLFLSCRKRGFSQPKERTPQDPLPCWCPQSGTLPWGWNLTPGAHGPTVAEVKRGAVDDFNQLNPLRTIQPHDMVLQMGDAKGTEAILAKMAAPLRDVKLTVHRPRRMQVKLRKEAKSSLGIKVILKEMCPGAVISDVNPTGLLGKWNAKNPSDAIAVSDRLLAVNGLTELKESLAEDLTNETELELTFLKY